MALSIVYVTKCWGYENVLTFEIPLLLQLIIVAYDLGDHPQEATRVLDVVVLDIDDNKPKFNRPLVRFATSFVSFASCSTINL